MAQLRRRQNVPREPVPDLPRRVSIFNLDETLFGRNVRSAKRGAAGGPEELWHQQLGPAVEAATAPFQHALSTRAGCECVSHALQALCDMDEDATITSIDGISAYDTISRRAMLQGLEKVPGGSAASPFMRLFHAEPSTYLWQDDVGTTHRIHQRAGGPVDASALLSGPTCSVGSHACEVASW